MDTQESKNQRPSISAQDRKLLWGKACNRCAICGRLLINLEDGDERGSIVAVECHIVGHSKGGPRGNSSITPEEKIKYENLILLCLEHSKTIDDRPDVWSVEKLRKTKSDHETKMRTLENNTKAISPKLRLVQPVGYTGGPSGHFQTLVLRNFGAESALEVSCELNGIGFNLQLTADVSGSYLDPGLEKGYQLRLDGETIYNKEIKGLVFRARYKNANDETIEYVSNILQVRVPSDAFYILKLGSSHTYELMSSDIFIDKIVPLDSRGDYDESMYVAGENKFKIKVSRTLFSCWGFQGDEIQSCLNELALANIQVMIKLNQFLDRDYSTYSFPAEALSGYEGFVKAISLIKSGKY